MRRAPQQVRNPARIRCGLFCAVAILWAFSLPGLVLGATATYTYDELNRLTSATIDDSRIEYVYDSAGNILSVITSYVIVATKSGDGTGTVADDLGKLDCGDDCDGVYDNGIVVTLTATPDIGSAFDQWTGACTGNGACMITVDEVEAVEAVFLSSPPSADLVVSKTDGMTEVVPGQSTTYTIVVQNNGPDDVFDADFQDDFPAELNCSYTSVESGGATGNTAVGAGSINDTIGLPFGASVTYTADCDIAVDATGTLSNTATVSSSASDPSPGNESATDESILVPTGDLSITKSDGVMNTNPGETLVYTIVVSNAGPSDMSGAMVSDNFPSGLSCVFASSPSNGASGNTSVGSGNINDFLNLPVGSSVTYTAQCGVTEDAPSLIANTATVSTPDTDPVSGNNSATDETIVGTAADLSVSKSNGVSTVTPGLSTTYTIVVLNNGPSAVVGATLTDIFPTDTSCTFTSIATDGVTGNTAAGSGDLNETLNMPADSSVTYVAPCDIDPGATGNLVNSAAVMSGLSDPASGDESSTDDDVLIPLGDLGAEMTSDAMEAFPGGEIVYTIVVDNSGPSDVLEATVTDTFPSELTCSFISVASAGASGNTTSGGGNINDTLVLPLGSSVTYTASCEIDQEAKGPLSNTVSVASPTADPNLGDETDTVEVPIVAAADLSITKTDGETVLLPGSSTTYVIVVTNNGPSEVDDALVTDKFPPELDCTYTSGGVGGATGNTLAGTGNIGDTLVLPSGAAVTYTADCDIDPSADGPVINTATVSSTTPDSNSGDESASDETLISLEVIQLGGFEDQ